MRAITGSPIVAREADVAVSARRRTSSWRWLLPDPLSVLGLLLLLGLWQLAHYAVGTYFPTPFVVTKAAIVNFYDSRYFVGLGLPEGGYLPHLLSTTFTVLEGVAVGGAIGTATGLASAMDRIARQIFAPLVAILGTVPILVAAPFFLIWFGLAESSKVILVALYSGVVLHLYAERSLDNLSPRFREYADTLGATWRLTLRAVVLPGVLPELFGGIRTALGAAWGLATIAELLGAMHGIGRVIIATWGVYDIAAMMAGILMLALIAVALDAGVMMLRHRVTRWADIRGNT